ncbi:MAG TPA: hypothetical protein VK484_08390 [Ferruginibacter sp.]|nr:hypothetical protein [Ferruginibacter sp.]
MKKVILALAIVSVTFAACNDGKTEETTSTSDTTTVVTPAPADTAVVVTDTTMKVTTDTIKK